MADQIKLDAATQDTLARLASDVNAIRHTLDALVSALGTVAEAAARNARLEVEQRATEADDERKARVAKFKATSEGMKAANKVPPPR